MEKYYISTEFEKRCTENNIEIEDVRLYCNEGVLYEFKTREDLMKAMDIYVDIANGNGWIDCEEGYRFEVTSCGDVHHLFDMYPPDLD